MHLLLGPQVELLSLAPLLGSCLLQGQNCSFMKHAFLLNPLSQIKPLQSMLGNSLALPNTKLPPSGHRMCGIRNSTFSILQNSTNRKTAVALQYAMMTLVDDGGIAYWMLSYCIDNHHGASVSKSICLLFTLCVMNWHYVSLVSEFGARFSVDKQRTAPWKMKLWVVDRGYFTPLVVQKTRKPETES